MPKAIDTFDRDIGKPLPPLSTPGLTARERDIVKLAATLRQRDLAEMLGCSTGAVEKVLRRARLKAEAQSRQATHQPLGQETL